jgi:hypothetical protein
LLKYKIQGERSYDYEEDHLDSESNPTKNCCPFLSAKEKTKRSKNHGRRQRIPGVLHIALDKKIQGQREGR